MLIFKVGNDFFHPLAHASSIPLLVPEEESKLAFLSFLPPPPLLVPRIDSTAELISQGIGAGIFKVSMGARNQGGK
jgi:hypothetical protein